MQLSLTEDQTMLAQTAQAFLTEHSPLSRVRQLRDGGDALGYSRRLLSQMAELGWTAIPFAEADGGLGMGLSEAILVTEAMGRTLCPEPLIPSTLAACQALALAGSEEQRGRMLASAIEGQQVVALAYQERGARFDPREITCSAQADGGGYRLSGEKTLVFGGVGADAYVVVARTAGQPGSAEGLSLFLVPANYEGLEVTTQHLIDGRNAAQLTFKDVKLAQDDLVGQKDAGGALLDDVLDRATVALCGEMLGGMQAAFDMTLGYLKERKQFGVLVGTFQALQHRAAQMYIQIELARSATMAAARAMDAGDEQAKAFVSNAKARCSDAYVLVANEAVQMHGGIGMTDEHDVGFFMKRARAAEMTYGDAAYHRDRFATLNGY